MMTIINLIAASDLLSPQDTVIGHAGDHLAATLVVSLDTHLHRDGQTYRLLFETAEGFRCMTEVLTPDSRMQLTFAVPNVLTVAGPLSVQLLVYAADGVIAHTPKCHPPLEVLPSIETPTAIPTDYTGLVYPGVGIRQMSLIDGVLTVTYEDGRAEPIGRIALGEWGPDTREIDGEEVEVDTYWTMGCYNDAPDYIRSNALRMYVENDLTVDADDYIRLHTVDEVHISGDAGTYIRNVTDPEADGDAVNKRYVDNVVKNAGGVAPEQLDAKQDKFAEVDNSLSYLTKLTPNNNNKILQLDCLGLDLQATGQMALKKLNIVNGADANKSAIIYLETVDVEHSAATKGYVDGLVGDIETALDGIIAVQNALIGGDA